LKRKKATKARPLKRGKTVRGPGGRFEPGTAGGPGRPPRASEAAYLSVVASACSEEDFAEIVAVAVKHAKEGDDKARRWLGSYLLGLPTSRVEVSSPGSMAAAVLAALEVDSDKTRQLALSKLSFVAGLPS
jgi:hypothetical protein